MTWLHLLGNPCVSFFAKEPGLGARVSFGRRRCSSSLRTVVREPDDAIDSLNCARIRQELQL